MGRKKSGRQEVYGPIDFLKTYVTEKKAKILKELEVLEGKLEKSTTLRCEKIKDLNKSLIEIGADRNPRVKYLKEINDLETVCIKMQLTIQEIKKSLLIFEGVIKNLALPEEVKIAANQTPDVSGELPTTFIEAAEAIPGFMGPVMDPTEEQIPAEEDVAGVLS